MLTVYAREGCGGVNFYRDKEATQFIGNMPSHYCKLDKRNKYVTLNCYRYNLVWLDCEIVCV
jgi:hypothetical protein